MADGGLKPAIRHTAARAVSICQNPTRSTADSLSATTRITASTERGGARTVRYLPDSHNGYAKEFAVSQNMISIQITDEQLAAA